MGELSINYLITILKESIADLEEPTHKSYLSIFSFQFPSDLWNDALMYFKSK
jgi:hypothetical protein